MAKSVVVAGPQGCGKSKHKEAIRKHYGMSFIIDGWHPGNDEHFPKEDYLVLTNYMMVPLPNPTPEQQAERDKIVYKEWDEVKKEMGIE